MISIILTILAWIAVILAGILVLIFGYFILKEISDNIGVDFIAFLTIIITLLSGFFGAIYLLGGF